MTDEDKLSLLNEILPPVLNPQQLVATLEAHGLAIYRKKKMRNRRRPNSSQPMSPTLAEMIREAYDLNPTATQSELASWFNVNIGRVAEALRGRH
ncbi:MAG: hypothetical protein LW689_04420 [Novosphingobium sp.]|jgi:hypothetical protein|nr:hypothetical protein [Novosphingobium sp.]MCE2842029.1 hypothetical protein [Novosphingobium sp.]